ncbi:hypothetical protein GCM10017600_00980 [Streptosporangium carneum]|uniref:Uncharacterized protein n=1 Tax=Streptosporangium carneum TaxID=47481 RepID=A0A9W6HVA6_9ACTN|nr:hypothetical protein GCM10017600_00980 [Streptosporangium carneum]
MLTVRAAHHRGQTMFMNAVISVFETDHSRALVLPQVEPPDPRTVSRVSAQKGGVVVGRAG